MELTICFEGHPYPADIFYKAWEEAKRDPEMKREIEFLERDYIHKHLMELLVEENKHE